MARDIAAAMPAESFVNSRCCDDAHAAASCDVTVARNSRAMVPGMEAQPEVRPIQPADLPVILALNNAHAREISLIDEGGLARLLAIAARATAIGPPGTPEAFLIAFDHETPVQGPNHAWFLARHPRFFYVDRVCVEQRARKRGLARRLYADAFAAARASGLGIVCCEVN